jgi:hypothetical protein
LSARSCIRQQADRLTGIVDPSIWDARPESRILAIRITALHMYE